MKPKTGIYPFSQAPLTNGTTENPSHPVTVVRVKHLRLLRCVRDGQQGRPNRAFAGWF
ncbi:MAG: hypothetical protein JXB29_13185 [Sedimentisphaerales bacterium]|nr:hypothetical protein [Sedimentisphaerales bacterium]